MHSVVLAPADPEDENPHCKEKAQQSLLLRDLKL